MSSEPVELSPPWEAFPAYERHTIGWRMGFGEAYMADWHNFLGTLASDYDTRLAYLQRHRPAPLSWGDVVLAVLLPGAESDHKYGCSSREIERLLRLKLVEHDAAYKTWLAKQLGVAWPWSMSVGRTPEDAARYGTRELWFFSRQLQAGRQEAIEDLGTIPVEWQILERELSTGQLGDIDPSLGLLTLAQMLCAGDIRPPWVLGLSPSSFTDSYEVDMAFADAYRLWLTSAFDDDMLLRSAHADTSMPSEWRAWIDEQVSFDGC